MLFQKKRKKNLKKKNAKNLIFLLPVGGGSGFGIGALLFIFLLFCFVFWN